MDAEKPLVTVVEKLAANQPLDASEVALLRDALERLVRLTLWREGRARLQAAVNALKYGSTPDVEAAKQKVREAGIEPDALRVLGPLFCDRLCAGVDEWDRDDQDDWVEACQIVTEMTASHI